MSATVYDVARDDPYAHGWETGYKAALAQMKIEAERLDTTTYRVIDALTGQLRRRVETIAIIGGARR